MLNPALDDPLKMVHEARGRATSARPFHCIAFDIQCILRRHAADGILRRYGTLTPLQTALDEDCDGVKLATQLVMPCTKYLNAYSPIATT